VKLAPGEFDREVERIVNSPAWPELLAWFTDRMVRRVIAGGSGDALEASANAARDVAGAQALLLAMQNHVSTRKMEAMNVNRTEGRVAAKAEAERSSSGDSGKPKRARRAGQQASAKGKGGTG
jgi:hypothetical protein